MFHLLANIEREGILQGERSDQINNERHSYIEDVMEKKGDLDNRMEKTEKHAATRREHALEEK